MADQPAAASPQIQFSDFVEAASRAALRAVDAHNIEKSLNPQPLPPGQAALIPPGRIFIGIIAAPEALAQ